MKPRRALWGWGGVVLGVHALVLANLPRHATPLVAPALAHTFTTRTVVLPVPETTLAAAAVPVAAPSPPAAPSAVRTAAPPAKPAPRRAAVRSAAQAGSTQAVAAIDGGAQGSAAAPAEAVDPPGAPADLEALAPTNPADGAGQGALPLQTAQPDDGMRLASAGLQAMPSSAETAPDAAGSAATPPAPAAAPAAPAAPAAGAPAAPAPSTPPSTADTAVGQAIFAPGAAQAQAGPAPPVRLAAPQLLKFDVTGQAKSFQYSARAELLWQHDGHHYQARQQISLLLLGSRTQSSSGTLGPAGLQPQRFGDRTRSEKAAHFDYGQQRVTFSANAPDAPLAAGTQDRLSVFVQLGALLAAAPERYPVGTRIQLATAGTGSVDAWTFTVEGEETLNLPLGSLQTLRLQRLPRADHDYDQKAQLWLAPTLGYLPARIRLTQANGDFADLRLMEHSAP